MVTEFEIISLYSIKCSEENVGKILKQSSTPYSDLVFDEDQMNSSSQPPTLGESYENFVRQMTFVKYQSQSEVN